MKKFIRVVGVLLSVGVAFARGSFAAESVTPTIPASAYIQDGLIAQWDGIENAGAGQHDTAATEWVDLTGKAFNWSVSSTGQWTEFGLRAKSDSNIATHGMPFKDFRTVEVRFDHSESAAERYLICWGDPTNKRCLSEHKTGSYGGPAFLMAHNEQTQCLVSESTNTVVGVYDAGDVLSCYVNGGPAVASGTKDTWSNKGTSCFLLRPTGKSFFAIRCYDRELSANEIAYNATIDKIRYEGEDPATIEWPDGFKYENGQIYYRVTVDAGAGTASFDNTSFNSTISKWLPMGEEATIAAYVRPSGSQVFVAVRGVDSSSIANNVVTFKVSSPTTATLRYNSGEHPTTGMSARNYIQKGLMGHWDGIETGAFGYKTDEPTVWVDLSNKAFDWTVNLENGEWTDLGLRALNANRMATFDRAYMLFSTIEVVFEHDDTAAERYILCWGDTSSKRMLCETMTNSSRFGGPAFLFYAGSYTQYLIANGTNTCAAIYNGFYASTTLNSSYCNGVPSTSTGKTDNFGNEGTSCYLLRPAGKSYFAIRLYDRQLSAGELAFNSAIDDVRYRGADPTTYDWPEGYKYENGQLYYRVSATSEVGQVSFDGSSYSSYVEDWVPMNEARNYTLYVQDVAGYFFDHVDGLPQGTVYEQKAIPFTAEGIIAAVAAYRASVEQAFTTADYAQDGLIGFWDGIENYGPNDHFVNAKIWKDLSGQAFDWTIQDFYAKWIDLGLCSTQSPASDWSMAMANSSVAYKNFVTAEIVFDQSESAVERYLICWGDTTNKRMLSEHKTGSSYGGPAFLMTSSGQTQYLEAEGTNTVVGIYTGDTLTANYVNGELAQGTGKTDNFSSKGSVCYLTRPQGKSFFAIRLYNRALTPVEIERHRVLDSIRYKGIVPEGYLVQDGKIYARVKVASTDGTQITINDEPLTEHDIWIELGHATTIRATANVASDKIATWEGLPSGASATATTVDFTISSAATITMTPKTVEFVEYVESNTSDGSQYIDMGTHFTVGHRLTLEWSASSLDGLSGENAGWGTGVDNAHITMGAGRIYGGVIRPQLIGSWKDFAPQLYPTAIVVGDRWVDVCEVSDKAYYTTTHVSDGQKFEVAPFIPSDLSTYDSGNNIHLFRHNSTTAQSGKKRIYHAVYEDLEGNKLMELVPAKIDGVPAMLDLLTMKPYYSAGTASLVASETLSNRYRYNDGKVEYFVNVSSADETTITIDGETATEHEIWPEYGQPHVVHATANVASGKIATWEGLPSGAIATTKTADFAVSGPTTVTMAAKAVEFVEYVESNTSDGSQYIDMGFHFTANHRITIEWSASSLTGLSSENKGWGAGTDDPHTLTGAGRTSGGYIRPFLMSNNKDFSTAMPTSKIIVGDRWVDVCEASDKIYYSMTHVLDGQKYEITPVTPSGLSTYDSGNNIYLFKHNHPSVSYPGKKRIYHVVYEDLEGNKLLELVPVTLDHEPAMFDLLTMKVYFSAGTASLIAGEATSNRYRFNDEGRIECCVTVTSSASNPISVNDGVFVAETNAWFEVGLPVTVKCQVGDAYRFEGWKGAPANAVVGENQISFTATPCSISPLVTFDMPVSEYIQEGLIAMWDGIDNAGTGTHDPSATEWVDLMGGESWALQAKGSFSENALVCAGGGLAATRENAIFSIQTMDIRFEQTKKPGGVVFGSGQRTGGYSCYIGYASSNFNSDTPNVGFRVSTSSTQGVPQTSTILYNLESGLYSTPVTAIYKDGAVAEDTKFSDYYGSNMDHATLGARIDNNCSFIGNIYALRLYSRKLTDAEIGINTAIDKIRFEHADPASDIWPDGVRWNSEKGALEYRLRVVSADETTITIDDETATEHDFWFDRGDSLTIHATANVASGKIAIWEGLPSGASATATTVDFTVSLATTITMTPQTVEFAEYVESNVGDGSLYIDMGTHFTAGHRFTLEWSASSLDGLSSENIGWGAGEDNAHLLTGGGRISNGSIKPYILSNNRDFTTTIPTSKIAVGDRWVDVCEVSDKVYYTTTHVADGQNYAITPVTSDILSTYDSGKNICLFKSMPNSAQSGKKRIYHALYEDVEGNKVMDLIPAKIGGVPAMLDLLTMKPYYSAGTASLVASETLSNRYRYNDGKVECLVTVTSTAANPVSVNEGVFVAATNAWVEFGSPVTVECQVADHYRFARWDGAPQTAIVSGSQISFTASPYAISTVIAYDLPTSAYVQRNLVEQWDGLENAGRGKPHDSSLDQWIGLVGGKVLAFSTYVGKNFNENSLQSLSGSYYIADCKTITTNDFNVFDGFVYESTECAASSYEPLFGSNTRIIWLRSDSLGLSQKKAYSVSRANPAGNMNVYAAYVPGTDIPSSVYVDGEQLTTEVTPNPNNIAYFDYLSIGLSNQYRLRGGWYALRLYKKELSEAEQTVNRLVDKVRFESVDPAELTWPTGMRIKDGVLEVCLTVTFNEKGSVTLNGETVESGVKIWVEKDSPVTLVATPEAACKLKTWSGYYFDDLPTFERQDLEFSFIANMPADLGAQFVDESAGIWNIPGDFDTLAEALASDDVTDGDTIRIASGEYAWDRALDEVTGFTYLAVVRKAVKIEGVGGADAVTLDCGQEGGILLDNPDAVLSGITFKNFTINKNVSSRALCVTQGVATNIIVNGAGGSGTATANVVYIDTNGTLMDSEVRGVTNGLWGGNQVQVRGGAMKRVKVFACMNYGFTTYFDAGDGNKRARCEDCDFINNSGYHGNVSTLSTDFVRCRFIGNDSFDNGLVITVNATTTVTLTDCVFMNNKQVAFLSGQPPNNPLIFISGGATQFLMTNCLIAANSLYQGGVFKPNTSNNNLELINCTVYGNESRLGTVAGITQGGSSTSRAKVTMRNTIFRNNLASGEDVEFAEELPYVDFTFDHSCYTGRPIEEGSIDEDPKFKDAAAGDYMLDKGSPCVDTGIDVAAPKWDVAGNPRPVDGDGDGVAITDMGCYEKPEPTEALEVALDVEVENDCAPGQAILTATVTGTKTTGLEYQWYWICTIGGTVTTNITGWIEDATYTFTNLGVGSYAFGCNVKNDAMPPDTATGEGKNAVRILPETTYVSTTGSDEDNFPYDSKEKAAGTLATAYANAGRKVVILPGTYTFDHAVDEVTGLDCQLAVRRAITITSEGNPSEVILDCQGKNAFIVDHAQAAVSGFTLKNFLTEAGSGPVVQVNLGAISNVVVDGEIPATVAGDCISLATGTLADSIVVTNLHAAVTADLGLMPFRLVGATMRNSRAIGCLTGRHNNRTVVLATAGELSRRSRIENCLFVGNENTSGLGLVDVSRTDIIRCVFMGNLSKCSALAYSTMVDSIIVGNNGGAIESKAMYGGGIYHNSVTNCLVANNQIKGRPAVYAASGTAGIELINCTIANNESTAASLAGGVAISGAAEDNPTQLWLKNCIVWGNSVTGVVSDVLTEVEPYCLLYINNSCFSEAAAIPNAGNIAEDPLFRAPTQNNFTLRANSPCVDKGDNLNWKKKTDKDLLGQPRIQNRIIDMGCYEVQRVGTVFFIR